MIGFLCLRIIVFLRSARSLGPMNRSRLVVVIISVLLSAALGCVGLRSIDAPAVPTVILPTTTIVPPTAATTELTVEPTLIPTSPPTPIAVTGISPVSYRLPLTVQHVTPTTAILFFELDTPSDGLVLYAPIEEPARQNSITLSANEVRHQITLENLQPGTAYEVKVGLGLQSDLQEPGFGSDTWGTVTFHTPAEQLESIRFGVLGDSGFGEQATFDVVKQMAAENLDFAINTGDVVYRIDENTDPYEAYALKWYGPLESILRAMPVYPVVGNHDVEQSTLWNDIPFYYLAFPPFPNPHLGQSAYQDRNQWYAFAYGTVQFLMLDTQVFYSEPGRAEQDVWLAERLSDPSYEHTVVAFHVPPFSSGGVHQYDGMPVRSWAPLFEASNVRLVLQGHSHNYERLLVNEVTYVVSGGGSSSLYQAGEVLPESQVFQAVTHYVVIEIFADRIELVATAVTGEVIDQYMIPLP